MSTSPLARLDPRVPLDELDDVALGALAHKRYEAPLHRASAAHRVFWAAPVAPDLAKLPRLVTLHCYGRLGDADVARIFAQAAEHAWLQRLTVMQCPLTTIPGEVARLGRLYQLSLVDDGLRDAPRTLASLERVRLLDLSRNPLVQIDPAIGSLPALHTLRVGGTSFAPAPLTSVPVASTLTTLSLAWMPALATPLTGWPALDALALHGDVGPDGCPPELGELTGLTSLALAYTTRPSLPESVRRLRGLRALWLPYGELETLPTWLDELTSLRTLALHGARRLAPELLVEAVLRHPSLGRVWLPFPFPAASRERLKKAGFRSLAKNPSVMFRTGFEDERDPFPEIR